MALTPEEVLARHTAINPAGCWIWLGQLDDGGYGKLMATVKGVRRTFRAHRVSYIAVWALVPDDLVLDHICRVRHCVRPDHLREVTNAENIAFGVAARTACRRGHTRTPGNVRIDKNGHPVCRPCVNLVAKERRQQKRAPRP